MGRFDALVELGWESFELTAEEVSYILVQLFWEGIGWGNAGRVALVEMWVGLPGLEQIVDVDRV